MFQRPRDVILSMARSISEFKYPSDPSRYSDAIDWLRQQKKLLSAKSPNSDSFQNPGAIDQKSVSFDRAVEQFYYTSFEIFKAFQKRFEYLPDEGESKLGADRNSVTIETIVLLHAHFYETNELFTKAQEIKRIHKKKLCENVKVLLNQSQLLLTLLQWLYLWAKRKFEGFIKKNLHSLQSDIKKVKMVDETLLQKVSVPKGRASKTDVCFEDKNCPSYKVDQISEFLIRGYLTSPKNKLQTKGQIEQTQVSSTNVEHSPLGASLLSRNKSQPTVIEQIEVDILLQQSLKSESKQTLKKVKDSRCKSIANQADLEREILLGQILNKELFYGSFHQEISQQYKSLSSCMESLDGYYLKTFKKRKQENREIIIKDRLGELANNFAKNMAQIKASVDLYGKQYAEKCPFEIKQFNRALELKRSQESKKSIKVNKIVKKVKSKNLVQKPSGMQKSQIKQPQVTQSGQEKSQFKIQEREERDNCNQSKFLRRNKVRNSEASCLKLPVVSNEQGSQKIPENESASTIHQSAKVHSSKKPLNKALIRYKMTNSYHSTNSRYSGGDCERSHPESNLLNRNSNSSGYHYQVKPGNYRVDQFANFSVSEHFSSDFELRNIRKILKQREKEKSERIHLNQSSSSYLKGEQGQKRSSLHKELSEMEILKSLKWTELKKRKEAQQSQIQGDNRRRQIKQSESKQSGELSNRQISLSAFSENPSKQGQKDKFLEYIKVYQGDSQYQHQKINFSVGSMFLPKRKRNTTLLERQNSKPTQSDVEKQKEEHLSIPELLQSRDSTGKNVKNLNKSIIH